MKEVNFKDFEGNILENLGNIALKNSQINPELFTKYQVKRGLRDLDGKVYL